MKRQNRINRIEEDLENEQSSMESLESKVSSLETSCSPGGMSGKVCEPITLTMIINNLFAILILLSLYVLIWMRFYISSSRSNGQIDSCRRFNWDFKHSYGYLSWHRFRSFVQSCKWNKIQNHAIYQQLFWELAKNDNMKISIYWHKKGYNR